MSVRHAREKYGSTDPDLLVVGAGSAGFSAAITAADAGADVILIGSGMIGGTCVNVGCVPSKNLIRAMQAIHDGQAMVRFDGIQGAGRIVDWAALIRQKNGLVEDLRKARYENLLGAYPNIYYIAGTAWFTGDGTQMRVGAATCRPKKIVLATGASSALPPINGIQRVPVLDSTSALELDRIPDSLMVVGGGPVGCELGQMFARAGAEVTICCRRRLLPNAEPEASEALADCLRSEGVTVREGVHYQTIERTDKGVRLVCETEEGETVIDAEQSLAAVGRRPNTKALRLGRAGIGVTANGGLQVDEFMRSTHPDVYAAGDVTGRDMLVYMAAYGGKIAARNALNGNAYRYTNAAMPEVVFTDPQVATAGMTGAQARAKGLKVKTSTLPLDNVPRFIASLDTRGLIKLTADADTDKLLGASVVAPEAGDSIQTVVMALKAGLTTSELADTIFPYLTAVEGLKLAAQSFSKDVNKLSCCAG